MHTPTGSGWMSDNYITRLHQFESVQFQSQFESVGGQDASVRISLQWHTVEQPSQDEKKVLLWSEELWSICGSLSPFPTHLSHITNINAFTTLSRIKCERYIFLKTCVRSFVEVRHYCWYMHLPIFVYVYVLCVFMQLYNISLHTGYWLKASLYITNQSVYSHLFTQLNDQTVLFLTIHISMKVKKIFIKTLQLTMTKGLNYTIGLFGLVWFGFMAYQPLKVI